MGAQRAGAVLPGTKRRHDERRRGAWFNVDSERTHSTLRAAVSEYDVHRQNLRYLDRRPAVPDGGRERRARCQQQSDGIDGRAALDRRVEAALAEPLDEASAFALARPM